MAIKRVFVIHQTGTPNNTIVGFLRTNDHSHMICDAHWVGGEVIKEPHEYKVKFVSSCTNERITSKRLSHSMWLAILNTPLLSIN